MRTKHSHIQVNKSLYFISYAALLIITILGPSETGVALRYGIIPFVIMTVAALLDDSKITVNRFHIYCVSFIIIIFISTILSPVVSFGANARSTLILIIFFSFLADKPLPGEQLKKLENIYIVLSVLCCIWAILISYKSTGSIFNIRRGRLSLLFGHKDVNYFLAIMIPSAYFSFRNLFWSSSRLSKFTYAISFLSICVAQLILRSRASFVTLLVFVAFVLIDKLSKTKLTVNKVITVFFMTVVVYFAVDWLFSNPLFNRITEFNNYGGSMRFIIWREAIKAFLNRPLIGSGLGSATEYSLRSVGYYSHNNYIDILGDTGIIGASLFVLMIGYFCQKTDRRERIQLIAMGVAFFLPFASINGLQTLSFWVPSILFAHETCYLSDNHDDCDDYGGTEE